ncbi:hypothetical protein PC120_g5466 [Phytophthora cactorum]|nr:hypothetical protein PC120_g5466 [Phytophthora cactorum]
MSGMHRFKSIYEDDSCSEAPTGVFVKRLNDCKNQVASDGTVCEALYNDDDNLIGYVEDSCYDGRGAGFDALFDGESYMAYDYFYGGDCTDYENSAAYRASGDCETLIDDDSPARSATISVTSSGLVWTRNMGPTATSLGCPGEGAPGYYEFDVPSSDINTDSRTQTSIDCSRLNSIIGFIFNDPKHQFCYGIINFVGDCHLRESGKFELYNRLNFVANHRSQRFQLEFTVANPNVVNFYWTWALCWSSLRYLQRCCCPRRGDHRVGVVYCEEEQENKDVDSRSLRETFLGRSTTDGSDMSSFGPGLWNNDTIIATRVPRDQVVAESLICCGGYGEVYRGTYNHEPVAIKILLPDMRSDLKKVNSFLAEAKLMASLAHPHIVRFVGVSWASLSDLCVLSELMKGGDLRSLLQEFEARGRPQGIDDDKVRIAYHVAQALTYLHSLSPVVIHRDLKSKNVLLTENMDAKLTDFGISKEQQDNTMTAGVGTMLWMAPEVMMAERYTEKADIFSFGVLLSELDLHTLPYSHAMCDSVTGKKLESGVSGSTVGPMVVFRLQQIMKGSFGEGYVI